MLWYNANELATAAAQDGAQSARVVGGTAQAGIDRADSLLDQRGGPCCSTAKSWPNAPSNTPGWRSMLSRIALIPGLHLSIDVVADSGTEQFVGR